MSVKNIAGAVLVVVLLGFGFYQVSKIEPARAPAPVVGALSSPDIPSQYLRVGGVIHEYRFMNWNGGTSTPCSFVSPSSTSTLVWSSLKVDTSTSTAVLWKLATSTIMNATTSGVTDEFALGSGAKGTMYYNGTTTPTLLDIVDSNVLPANTYVTWGFEGVLGYSSTAFGGTCSAEFIVH